jgi:hypothetical protein
MSRLEFVPILVWKLLMSVLVCHTYVSPHVMKGNGGDKCLRALNLNLYITATLRSDPSPPIYLNDVEIPSATTVKYLGLHLDTKLNWKEHIVKKRKQMDLRYK